MHMLGDFPMRPPVPVWDASGEEDSDRIELTVIEPLSPSEHFILTGELVVPVVEMTREEFRQLYPEAALCTKPVR